MKSSAVMRGFAVPVMAVVLASPLLHCGGMKMPGGLPGVPGVGACPDLTKPESILAFDFANEFKISAEGGAKLKAGTAAAVELEAFAGKIDAELKAACGDIATDLGVKQEFKDGPAACEAAMNAITAVKGKIGANAKIALTIKPPRCSVEASAMADCAAKCDANVKPGSVKVECEGGKVSGTCDANCSGSCDVEGGAKCDGECHGTCDAAIKGKCSGKCDGKCDGKTSKGAACAGTCDGKCDAQVEGSCSGKCGGECKLKAEAKCEGTCSGKCSAEMKAPKCEGEVKPPEMSAECKGSCDANVTAKAECTPAKVGLVITGAADAEAAAKLKATLEKNLPAVLKVAIGMKDGALKMAGNVKDMVAGVQASIKDIAASGGGAGAALTVGNITACVGGVFKGAAGAAANLSANVDVSVKVSGSASASGGGSGAAGGKTAE